MNNFVKIGVFGLIACPTVSLAYEQATHKEMSIEAVKFSVLNNSSEVLSNLGLRAMDDEKQKFPNSAGDENTLIDLIQYGAFMEDEGTFRPLNHFYDPVNDIGVNILGVPIAEPTPDWALKTDRLHHPEQQEYSLKDAYEYLFRALTLPDAPTRKQNFFSFPRAREGMQGGRARVQVPPRGRVGTRKLFRVAGFHRGRMSLRRGVLMEVLGLSTTGENDA